MSNLDNKKNKNEQDNNETKMPFGRDNYLWVLIGIAFLLVGFLLMIGGGSDDPDVFNEAIFSFRRLTLAPILVLAGFCIEIYAIMKKPKNK
jgi:hypothetical protein